MTSDALSGRGNHRVGRWALFAGRRHAAPGDGDLSRRFEEVLQGLRSSKGPGRMWLVAAFALLVLLLIFRPWVVIPNGEGGVVFSAVTGVRSQALASGFHFIVPVVHRVTRYNTRVQTYVMSGVPEEGDVFGDDSLDALTADGQKVQLNLTVTFRLPREQLPELHRAVGPTYKERIIRPEARSVARMVCAQHPVQDYTSEARDTIVTEIERRLTELFAGNSITLENVIIDNVEFSDEFRAAVEEKQKALQESEQMSYRIQEAQREAERVVVAAEGDAAAIAERGRALERNPLLIQYEYIEKIAPNVGGIILTPAELEKSTKAGSVVPPSPPEMRTKSTLDTESASVEANLGSGSAGSASAEGGEAQ